MDAARDLAEGGLNMETREIDITAPNGKVRTQKQIKRGGKWVYAPSEKSGGETAPPKQEKPESGRKTPEEGAPGRKKASKEARSEEKTGGSDTKGAGNSTEDKGLLDAIDELMGG